MTLNEKLVILRKKAEMTQGELATALDVSRQSVHKWESGQCYPEVPKLIGIKALFGISIDDLLDETVEIEMPEKKRSRRVRAEASEEENVAPVLKNTAVEAPAAEVKEEVKTESVPEQPKDETPVTEIEEITLEVIENKEEPKAPEVNENKNEKKKGFFSKLFGRK